MTSIDLPDNHPLVLYLKKFNWSEVLKFGLVFLKLREGRLKNVEVRINCKVED